MWYSCRARLFSAIVELPPLAKVSYAATLVYAVEPRAIDPMLNDAVLVTVSVSGEALLTITVAALSAVIE